MADRTVVIVDGQANKPKARLTWDGKTLESDNPEFLEYLKKHFGSVSDGEAFLDQVLLRFKSGYMHAYQIGD